MPEARLTIDQTRLREQVMPQIERFVFAFTRQVVVEAQRLAPTRTRRLRNAIEADPVRRAGPWRVETGVSVKVPYAAPVHEGARPHVIRARHAAALSFFWPKVGRQVFFKRVNHPGNAPNPFLRNAVHRVASADPRITFVTD